MPAHASDPAAATADIAFADDAEQFTPKPLIIDLLRTRYCIPGSIFLVEDLESLPVPRSKRWKTVRLILGDGELCIQALLRAELHRFVDSGAVRVGCYVRLGEFAIHFQNVATDGGNAGTTRRMTYLVIEDLVTVGWHRAFTEPDLAPQRPQEDAPDDDYISDSDLDIEDVERLELPTKTLEPVPRPTENQSPRPIIKPTPRLPPNPAPEGNHPDDDSDDDDEEDGFEAMEVSETKTTQRRAYAKNLRAPIALARDWMDPSDPLKLTSLKSIPNLPFAQNWSVNVLAVIVSLSEIEPSHMPPFVQRTARLADPSTTKQVMLTVFLDAENFCPKVGSAVLLAGVKNHRFDGGCLKKYASDVKPERWWYENPRQLEWCGNDMSTLEAWWEQKQKQGLGVDKP